MASQDKTKNKTIAVVTYPGIALLDLVATKTVLDALATGSRYRTVTVGERTEPIASNTPMRIIPEKRFEEVPDPFAIIVPGGGANALKAMGNERLLNYLRFAEHTAELVSSVSTGAFVLAAASLLEGRQATTHPAYAEQLENLGINYVQSYSVEDGKFLTMEGVSAGIDTMLELVAKLRSEAAAKRIQTMIEYDPQPPFGAIDWSEADGDELGDTLDDHKMTVEEQDQQKTIAFVLYPGLTVFDLAGPLQIFSGVSQLAPQYRTVVVAERVEPIDTDIRVKMIPTHTFEEVPRPSVLLVPGGGVPTLRAMSNEAIRSYVRSAAETAEVPGSICTGALILGSVGLLEGRQATTHWAFYKILEELGAKYVRKRWVEDGKFIFSAGVSVGIDMALALAARLTDEETARRVQRSLGYDPHPPFGGIDYDHLGAISGTIRAGLSAAAPVIAARPKRLTRQGW
jgi:transcriptional regulator GlxA family with amidase domain